jgi:hypothetical protein
MRIDSSHLLGGIAVGIGATLLMDVWNLFLKRVFGIPSLNPCLLGRWLCHMTQGAFRHARISSAPERPFECTVGRVAHYSIGVVFAAGLVLLSPHDWLARPTLVPALLVGVGTVVFPFFIMQPAFGLGVASSKTPNPTGARIKSLMTHTAFGVGLYVCALAASYALRAHAQGNPAAVP